MRQNGNGCGNERDGAGLGGCGGHHRGTESKPPRPTEDRWGPTGATTVDEGTDFAAIMQKSRISALLVSLTPLAALSVNDGLARHYMQENPDDGRSSAGPRPGDSIPKHRPARRGGQEAEPRQPKLKPR